VGSSQRRYSHLEIKGRGRIHFRRLTWLERKKALSFRRKRGGQSEEENKEVLNIGGARGEEWLFIICI